MLVVPPDCLCQHKHVFNFDANGCCTNGLVETFGMLTVKREPIGVRRKINVVVFFVI